uniref:AB hydrolase-1 domain-containing protein n=1 Tax=Pristionchus pacificus TaxID=54126 RepID=A0A8R1V2S5_PRIPA
MVSSLLSSADLTSPIPENTRRLAEKVIIRREYVDTECHRVFYLETLPPTGHYTKGIILLLHGQSFTSSTWTEHNNISILAASGYRCIAPDLPGSGKTDGESIEIEDRPNFIVSLKDSLCLKEMVIICASMAAPYVFPLLGSSWIQCVIGIAPSHSHNLGDSLRARTPFLIVYGEKDTSLGPTSASNLSVLPNSRSIRLPSAGHAAYLGNPILFQSIAINFIELIRSYSPN